MQRRKTVPASMIHKKKPPTQIRQGVTDYRIIGGKRQQYTADHSPDRVSLLHKGVFPICNSGCSDSIVEISFVLRANSPSRWHLTRCLLLCSPITIHDITENGNHYFIDISGTIHTPVRFCQIDFLCAQERYPALSGGASRHLTGWVCIGSGPSSAPGFCRIILKHSLLFSAVFPILRTYNGTTYT